MTTNRTVAARLLAIRIPTLARGFIKQVGFLAIVVCAVLMTDVAQAQSTGDYRSAATGNWNAIATWERFNGTTWVAAAVTPTSADGVITIRSPHTVTISATVTYDQVVVDSGGQVTVASTITHTLANGAGTDLTINGTWLNSGGTWTVTGTAWTVGAGGTYIHNTTASAATPLGQVSPPFDAASTFIYRGSSTVTPAVSTSGRTYGNLVFESTAGSWSVAPTGGGTLIVNGDFTVGSGVTITTSQTGAMTFAGNFTINGTLTNSTGTQIYTFTGSNKTISGSGAISFETFNVNSGAFIIVSSPVTEAATFTGTINGDVWLAAAFTNSGTLTVNGQLAMRQGGSATGTPFVYGPSSGLFYFGTSPQTSTSIEFPSSSGPTNLAITNAAGVTLHADRTVNGQFSFGIPGAKLTTNANTLTLGSSASVSGASSSSYLIGNLKRIFAVTGSKIFDVGTANGYSPVTANVTAGTFPLDLTVVAVQGPQPNVNAGTSLQRYWTLTPTNSPTADLTFQYLAGDVLGNEANYQLARVSGGVPTFFPGTVTPATHTATLSNVSTFSDWTAGEAADTTPPAVTSVTVPVNGTYVAGQNLDFTVNFSEVVLVTGVPRIPITLNTGGTVYANYVSGSGSSALLFRYTVVTGNNDPDGISLAAAFDPNGGTVRDAATNDALTTLNGVPSTAGILVDAIAPTTTSIIRVNGTPTAAATVDYTVTFSESVVNVDTADFFVTATGVTGTSVTNVLGSGATRTVTVNTGTGASGTVRLDVNAPPTINDLAGNAQTTGFTTGEVYTIDRNSPSVSSVVRVSGTPTNAASVSFTVTFSSDVTGVDSTDFQVTQTTSGAAVTTVTPVNASVYTVAVNTGTGDGTIRLDVLNNGSIQSPTAVPLTGGTFTSGEIYTIDKTAPTMSSIVRVEADPTKLAVVHFTATFSESVTGVSASTFALAATGVTGASITGVTGSGTTYTVTVNTGSGDGTLGLNAVADAAVLDTAGNAFTAPFTGQVFTIDKTAPTVVSINRASADPTAAASVAYTVLFSEAVTGVDAADFSISSTGVAGTSLGTITGGGTTWTVNVNTGSGDGTLRLDLTDNDSIVDAATNPLGGTGAGNGNFTGQTYTIDKNAPTVVSINRVGAATTAAPTVSWTVTFSESVSGVDTGDFALVASGVTGTSITGVTGSGTTYTVTANSGSGSGTLGLNLVDDDSIVETAGFGTQLGGSGAGNGNFTGQVFTLDHTAPTVVSINRVGATPTAASSVQFTAVFSETVTGVNTADFALAASGVSGASITGVTGSGTTYTITVNTGTGSGTVGLNLVDDDSIIDAVSNPLGGAGAGNGNFTGQVYTVNRAPANHLVISQVYGGGGNSGATWRNDFIELFNPTGATVSVTGWSVQYASATGSTWQVTNLTGSIAPGHYYLVQESSNAAVGAVLPTPDASAGILMAAGAGKVALVNQTSALSGSCPLGITVIDFVGYGSTANCSETAPTGTPSATISVSRIDNGCTDTDHNNTDFTTGAVNPRNSASTAWSCGGLVGAGAASPSTVSATGTTLLTVNVTPGQSPASTGITAIADLTPIGGSASQTMYDDGTNGDVTIGDNIFSFNATVAGATSSGAKTINVLLSDAQARSGAATISLTVLGSTNPSGNGTATPASVAPAQSSLLTVAVTPGQNPTSSGITVSADLTSIGGNASQTLFDDGSNGDVTIGDGTFSYNATVSGGTSLGAKSLPVTILDAQARIGNTSISLNIQSASAPPAPLNLVATPGSAQVGLAWTASAGATGYNVYRSTTSGFYTSPLASNVPTNNYTDNTAINGTHYFYIVKATNGTESGPSNEANATPAAPQPAAGARIYFIDIGQGASTLIVSPTNKTLLVDGGPTGQGTSKVVPLLNALGLTVDFTVLTHYHIDHDDGLTETINANKVIGTSYDNGDTAPLSPPNAGGTRNAYLNYTAALAAHSGSITRVRPEDVGGTLAGTVMDLGGGMKATIVAQGGKLLSGGSIAIDNQDLNTESISVLVEYNNFDFVVSGDLTGGGSTSTAKTPDVETFVSQLTGDIDVVQYDHHGSTTANNPRFLRMLKAEAGVAEIGYTNTFGHPNRETVNKYLNIPVTSGNTYGGTALPNPGAGPVSYQTDPSPASDDRVSRQGYSGAAPANAGAGTILLKTDGTTAFTMESFDDGGVRLSAASHAYSLDAAGPGVTTNFPPTVIPSINPVVPTASDTVTVQALVNDKEDPITTVTLSYALNGAAQAPQAMALSSGFYTATISAQPNGTRVDYTVTATAGGKSTAFSSGYFAGTTPISSLRVLDALGEPLYLDYAARIQGTATSDTNVFSVGTNDDYVQDATGGINIWRTIQPSVPPVDSIASGTIYTIAGRIGELAGRFHLETTPPFASPTTPYTVTATGSNVITPAVKTIAQLNVNPESFEAQLVQINNCTVTSGTIPGSPASVDAFLTVSDGTGSFQMKVDKDTNVPGMATPAGAFTIIGIIQQDDFLRPFDSGYDIAPRSRVDLGGSAAGGPGLISIAAARIDVDGSGNTPGDYVPDLLNQTVHIQGVVTSINFRASNGSGIEYYIQDTTAGVDIFSTATTRTFAIGDNLDVIGTVKQFNGLTEIDPGATTTNLTVLAPGTLPPVGPQLFTLSALGDNGVGEDREGLLIRVNNVTLTAPPATWAGNTNYAITDASGAGTIRISPSSNLVGQAPPAGAFSVIGLVGQFDSAAPFDSGYQLFPRSTSDILPAVPATGSISSTGGTPQSATVGNAFAQPLQATVRDAGNAPIAGAGVTFTAPSSGASGTFSNGTTTASVITDGSGVATSPVFTANATAGSYSVTAANGAFTTTFSLTNLAQTATHFGVSAPANVTSGVAFNFTVTALNASNAVVPGYNGTVHFSSGSNGSLPADYTFVGGDNGTHTFSATLTTTGAQQIDVGDGSISGSANITVAPPPATHFSVTAPANVTSGVAFNVTVTALDASNATVPGYTGTVHFTSSSAGTLPSDYTFTGGDSGAHTFSVTLTTTGAQTITATDTVTASITGTANTTVAAPPATHFSVAAPANVTSGVAFNVTVTALDASNATVPGYTGTVHFTSSSAGTLPSDYTFTGGDSGAHTFSVTLTTTGAQSITATDTVTASISGTANTTVGSAPPPPATHYSVTAPANVTAGVAFNVTVSALDASNATVAGYTGTVHFTSSSAGTLPADYTFTGGDSGSHTFSVTLTTTGAQTVTATDTVTASITGTANTTVGSAPPQPATHYSVTAPANVGNGTPFNVTVTALDASNATVTGYLGTVHFTSSSAGTLPADYTFVAGDNGTHTFSVTLTTNGLQTITATDTVTASITGTASTTVACPPGPAPFANASNSGPACTGGSVNLFSSGSGTIFSWTGPGGFTSNQQNPTGITIAGTYTVTVSSPGPCGSSAQASTTVVFNAIPSATITTGGTACPLSIGNVASVPDAGAGATYLWSITNGSITAGAGTRSITFTAGASGNVHLTVTVAANGCGAGSTADVAITGGPTITLPAALSACSPSLVNVPFTLTGTGPWTVQWSDGFTQSGITSASSSRNINVAATMTLSVVSVSNASCTNNNPGASVVITIGGGPTITSQPQGQIVNPGQNGTFTVAASGGGLHYQWFVRRPSGVTQPVGTDSPSFTTHAEGNAVWFVRVTNACGSVDSDTVTLMVVTPRHHASH